MTEVELRQAITGALKRFQAEPLADAATHLLEVLGYASKKRLALKPNTLSNFLSTFSHGRTLNERCAKPDDWTSVDFLFQLTEEEVRTAANQQFNFESKGAYNGSIINSYLFFALELKGSHYSRSTLAGITREVNKLFDMPALILFRHGETLTLAIINRRLHKREVGKDVLEKVTLIHGIQLRSTHRAHVDILTDLSLSVLHRRHPFTNFVGLHEAWQKTLDTSELNKRFFHDLANWYFWALPQVRFPQNAPKDADGQDSLSLIRLITRVIFCWFLKEKGLLPEALFDEHRVPALLTDLSPKESTYYKAILQNLFFATLNQEMDKREFRKSGQNFMAHNLYRYKNLLKNPSETLSLFEEVPFMNGGLFECLDKTLGTKENPQYIRVDGFSDRDDNILNVPNDLFWGSERVVDLSGAYGESRFKSSKVAGLLHVFSRYKFTVAENTPIEEEVALDPELLGRVFENLLAAYNPETGATARKQTGAFYTPRVIVNYMVDESLIASLKTKLAVSLPEAEKTEERLRQLFAYNDQGHEFAEAEVVELIKAIDNLTILDPACGSGAFPMGILHKLVFTLAKLDPGNQRWKARQLAKAEEIPDATVRERVLADIEESFTANELDYGRKLYLIENCIYGVDIQPIAVQISKLRFFISLVVEQTIRPEIENRGIRPLPNLETKFVAANSLLGLHRPEQQMLRSSEIDTMEAELRRVRERHFLARTPPTKAKCRELDASLRSSIAQLLVKDGWDTGTAKALASWDPYDQNNFAEFFDAEWMFGLSEGFDVVIGNPPYIDSEGMVAFGLQRLRDEIQRSYSMTRGNWDIYIAFYELGFRLLGRDGALTYITPDKWISKPFGEELRTQTLANIIAIARVGRNVFESANVDAIICLLTRHKQAVLRILDVVNGELLPTRQIDKQELKPPFAFDDLFSTHYDLLRTLDKKGRKLSHYGTCENACATSDAYKLKPLIHEGSGGVAKKGELRIVNTGTIGRYVSKWGVREMTYLGDKYLRPVVSIKDFQSLFPNSYGKKAILPKIIIKGLNLLDGCLDPFGEVIPGKTTLVITCDELEMLKTLLAIINSKLAFFFLKEKYPASSYNQGTTFTKDMINNLPVPDWSVEDRTVLLQLVEQIIARKTADPSAGVSDEERKIDEIVFSLYGLSSKEIAIVNESIPSSTRIRGEQ